MSKVAVDIGGTFTDVVYFSDENEVTSSKSFTTPSDYSIGIVNALKKIDVKLDEIEFFIHGTTIALNTILQRNGAKTGLITTEGFRDVLEIMRTNRPDMYNLQQIKPEPIVPRFFRKEVVERIDYKGEIITPLDKSKVLANVEEFIRHGVTTVAVCFLNSYINPEHEKQVKKLIVENYPDLNVSISSDIINEWREFERTSTTVLNSYCKPAVKNYVNNLSSNLKNEGLSSTIQFMQSNGGLMSPNEFIEGPVKSVLSGPVGGVIAGEYIASLLDSPNIITLDIGGTSADIAIIQNSEATYHNVKEINRLPILFPTVDVQTIGAGGGSVAWLDKGGAIQVGPQSSGAYPGPICYRNGGVETTVTDANLLLGYLSSENFLGGEIKLDKEKAFNLTQESLANQLGMSVQEVALGIIQVINAKMVRALKDVLIQRGVDPREFSLVAFGGNGGLHATELARALKIPKVIIPVHPSVFSAFGMLSADLKYDVSKTIIVPFSEINIVKMNEQIAGLKEIVFNKISASIDQSISETDLEYECSFQLRYKGQESTIEVKVPNRELLLEDYTNFQQVFLEKHFSFYGYTLEDETVITNIKVTATLPSDKVVISQMDENLADENIIEKRTIYLPSNKKEETVSVYERKGIGIGRIIHGPLIIEDNQTTIVLFEKDSAHVDKYGNIIIEVGA